MLYILLFRQNSLSGLTLLMLLAILVSHKWINPLSGERTPSSNNSYKVKALLSSKKEKRKITEAKRVAILTKQIK